MRRKACTSKGIAHVDAHNTPSRVERVFDGERTSKGRVHANKKSAL
jgi:hypothetical protein